jgi:hypothetical protein
MNAPQEHNNNAELLVREWVASLEFGHLPPGKISDLTQRITTALNGRGTEHAEHCAMWMMQCTCPLAPGTARETLDALTDEQRADLFAEYCVFCGSKNKPCTCMNDE